MRAFLLMILFSSQGMSQIPPIGDVVKSLGDTGFCTSWPADLGPRFQKLILCDDPEKTAIGCGDEQIAVLKTKLRLDEITSLEYTNGLRAEKLRLEQEAAVYKCQEFFVSENSPLASCYHQKRELAFFERDLEYLRENEDHIRFFGYATLDEFNTAYDDYQRDYLERRCKQYESSYEEFQKMIQEKEEVCNENHKQTITVNNRMNTTVETNQLFGKLPQLEADLAKCIDDRADSDQEAGE